MVGGEVVGAAVVGATVVGAAVVGGTVVGGGVVVVVWQISSQLEFEYNPKLSHVVPYA